MPTHWESSTRPLFIKTVLVNGNRHAILTQEDPLSQTTAAKLSRPSSPQGVSSSSGVSSGKEEEGRKEKAYARKAKKKSTPPDLESCLVKLRVVLAQQGLRKPVNCGAKQIHDSIKKKKVPMKAKETVLEEPVADVPGSAKGCTAKPDINHNITVANFFTEPPHYCNHHQEIERIAGTNLETSSTAPTLGLTPDYDVPWNNVSSENYFTRPFYNRLSERVLQWLSLSSDKCQEQKVLEPRSHQEAAISTPKRRKPFHRVSSEDNSDEVRTDEDIETALSQELPKFSQELNRQHYLKASIPVKDDDYSTQLQESIAKSFSNVVSIRSGKYAEEPKVETRQPQITRRKGHLTRQIRLEDSSDDEGKDEKIMDIWDLYRERKNRQKISLVKSINQSKINREFFLAERGVKTTLTRISTHWQTQDAGKQQLHIFIPAIPDEEQVSESESVD